MARGLAGPQYGKMESPFGQLPNGSNDSHSFCASGPPRFAQIETTKKDQIHPREGKIAAHVSCAVAGWMSGSRRAHQKGPFYRDVDGGMMWMVMGIREGRDQGREKGIPRLILMGSEKGEMKMGEMDTEADLDGIREGEMGSDEGVRNEYRG